MDKQPEPLRERLLAQFEPDREKLATYRKEVQAMLEKNEQTLRLEKWQVKMMVIATGPFLMGILFTTLAGLVADAPFFVWPVPFWVWLNVGVCYILTSWQILKYFFQRSRVEMLKEVKGLELQLLEMKEQLQQRQA